MTKHTIQITIIDDTNQQECEVSCGVDWSSPEAIALASQRIKERFGEKVQLEYLDLSKPMTNRDALKWNEVIESKNLSLPVLLINGQLRLSGQFDIRQLLDATNAEMEIGAQW